MQRPPHHQKHLVVQVRLNSFVLRVVFACAHYGNSKESTMTTKEETMTDENNASSLLTTTCPAATIHGDVLAKILSFLPWQQVVTCRTVCHAWLAAVANTAVVNLEVQTAAVAQELTAMAHCLPALQGLKLGLRRCHCTNRRRLECRGAFDAFRKRKN